MTLSFIEPLLINLNSVALVPQSHVPYSNIIHVFLASSVGIYIINALNTALLLTTTRPIITVVVALIYVYSLHILFICQMLLTCFITNLSNIQYASHCCMSHCIPILFSIPASVGCLTACLFCSHYQLALMVVRHALAQQTVHSVLTLTSGSLMVLETVFVSRID